MCVCVCVCVCVRVCACVRVYCMCALALGVCSLIEFFSHRSVWQVALLASSVYSVQVLSWVRSCHIHLHRGTSPQSPPTFLETPLPSTSPPPQKKTKHSTFTVSPFQIYNSASLHISQQWPLTALDFLCAEIFPNKISIACKDHWAIC